jgi:hypothetical protein
MPYELADSYVEYALKQYGKTGVFALLVFRLSKSFTAKTREIDFIEALCLIRRGTIFALS